MPLPRAALYGQGENVHIAIRPEKLELSDAASETGATQTQGTLQNAAYLGERSHYYVKLDGLDAPVAVSAQNRVDGTLAAGEGKPVWLTWRDEAAVVLRSS